MDGPWPRSHGLEAGNGLSPGADDGIRTRDPHLGKVLGMVQPVRPSPLECGSVHPVSTQSTESNPVVERSTTSGTAPAVEEGDAEFDGLTERGEHLALVRDRAVRVAHPHAAEAMAET